MKLKSLLLVALLTVIAQVAHAQLRQLTILTEPAAQVWIDDVNLGRTSADGRLNVRTYVTGTHQIRVRAEGFRQVTRPLTATQRGELRIPLTKTTDPAEIAFQKAEAMSSLDREKAIGLYRQAISLNPKYAEAFLGMARVMAGAGDTDDALEAIRSARKARPIYPEATAVEGRLHKDNGDEEKAVAAFKRAVTEGRGVQPEALTGLGLLYKEKAEGFGTAGDYEEETANYLLAATFLRKAASQLPGSPDAVTVYQLLGDCYERAGKPAEANVVYEEYIRNYPDTPEVITFKSFIVQNKKKLAGDQ